LPKWQSCKTCGHTKTDHIGYWMRINPKDGKPETCGSKDVSGQYIHAQCDWFDCECKSFIFGKLHLSTFTAYQD